MKLKYKLLVAAISLAASTQASALIASPQDGLGNGEAIFAIWDPVTLNSYSQDLGLTWNQYKPNLTNAAYTFSASINKKVYNAAFAKSNPANLVWNVSVANNVRPDWSNLYDYGVIGTDKVPFRLNNGAVLQAISIQDQMATAQKKVVNGYAVNDRNPADNFAKHGTVANGAYAGEGRLWSWNWASSNGVNNSASIGDTMGFYYEKINPVTTMMFPSFVTKAAGDWAFNGKALSYAAPVSAVPVPAAIWLMGSGLIGLVGIARRKKA